MKQNDRKQLIQATLIVIIITLVSKLLGFLREVFIANKLGVSTETDVFLAAYIIPNFLFQMLIAGCLSVAIVPIFVKFLNKKKEFWKLFSAAWNTFFLVLLAVTVIGIIFAPWIIKIIMPGFTGDAYLLTVQLTRWMFPLLIFSGLATLIMGVLHTFKRFAAPALMPVVSNASIIILLIVLFPFIGIYSLVVGVLVGAILMLLVQLPSLIKEKPKFYFTLKHKALKKMFKLMLPLILSFSIGTQTFFINTLLSRAVASTLQSGSIAALNFANRLTLLVEGIIITPIGITIFPLLAAYKHKRDKANFNLLISKSLRLTILIIVPVFIAVYSLRDFLIKLLFQHGVFNATATIMTSTALQFYALGIIPSAIVIVLARAFYALEDILTPVVIGVISTVVSFILMLVLRSSLGYKGIALAISIGLLINMCSLIIALRRKIKINLTEELFLFLKAILASAIVVILGLTALPNLNFILQILLVVIVAPLIYLFILKLLKTKELSLLKTLFGDLLKKIK
jgi:putative peptidoglycan lipid II flippase